MAYSVIFPGLIGLAAAVYLLLWIIVFWTQDEREPPLAKTTFPFLGHAVSMIRDNLNGKFFIAQRDKYNHPIYTLRLPFQKIYIINATELVPALQRQWRLITFAPIFAGAGKVVGMSQEACDLMNQDLTDETKNFNYTWLSRVTPHLIPGSAGLDAMNRRAIEVICEMIEGLVMSEEEKNSTTGGGNDGGVIIGLQEWILKTMVLASTDAVYGDMNPFRDSAVARAWETVEMDFLSLVLIPLPSIISNYFAGDVARARAVLTAAFLDFVQKKGERTASTLLQEKYAHHREKLSDVDIAGTDIALIFAILGNTKPAAWWLIYHIFSDERILRDIRDELFSVPGLITTTTETETEKDQIDDGGGGICASIDLAMIRTHCPILLSTLQETLRYRAVSNSVRKVMEQDILLDGRYLLKKNSLVMLPHSVQHTSASAFGEDVNTFNHLRFVRRRKEGGGGGSSSGQPDRRAFYAFGGGHGMCPGRHFASMEMMALGVLLVLRFDITPVAGPDGGPNANGCDGKWVEPTCEKSPLTTGVPYPDEEIYVRVTSRDDGKTGDPNLKSRKITKWKVTYSGWETPLDMAVEDGEDQQQA